MGRVACAPVANIRVAQKDQQRKRDVVVSRLHKDVEALRAELAVRDFIRGAPPPALDVPRPAANCIVGADTHSLSSEIVSSTLASCAINPGATSTFPKPEQTRSPAA